MRIVLDILATDVTLAVTATRTDHLVAAVFFYKADRTAVAFADEGFRHGFFHDLAWRAISFAFVVCWSVLDVQERTLACLGVMRSDAAFGTSSLIAGWTSKFIRDRGGRELLNTHKSNNEPHSVQPIALNFGIAERTCLIQ